MEKYSRVLIVIFFLVVINLGLSLYILSKLKKPEVKAITLATNQPVTRNPASPPPATTIPASIQSDLNLIKAEIRALRESLNSSGLILETPRP